VEFLLATDFQASKQPRLFTKSLN